MGGVGWRGIVVGSVRGRIGGSIRRSVGGRVGEFFLFLPFLSFGELGRWRLRRGHLWVWEGQRKRREIKGFSLGVWRDESFWEVGKRGFLFLMFFLPWLFMYRYIRLGGSCRSSNVGILLGCVDCKCKREHVLLRLVGGNQAVGVGFFLFFFGARGAFCINGMYDVVLLRREFS